jgi:hypothetical protein
MSFSNMSDTQPITVEERAKQPNCYWCIRLEGEPPQYYWEEEPVSREEYIASGKPDC